MHEEAGTGREHVRQKRMWGTKYVKQRIMSGRQVSP